MSEPLKLRLSGKTTLEVAVNDQVHAWEMDLTKTVRAVDGFRVQLRNRLAAEGKTENFEYLEEVQRLITDSGGPAFEAESDLEEFYDLIVERYWDAKKKRLKLDEPTSDEPTLPPSTKSTPAPGTKTAKTS